MKKFNKNSGFTVIEGLLILVILVIIGSTGWYVWHSQKNADKTYDSSSDTSQTASSNNKSTTTQQYLVIKEWGVKVPEMPAGNMISYEISPYGNDEAYFVSSEQKALGGQCGEFTYARYDVFRAASGYKSNDDMFNNELQAAVDNGLNIKIGNYTYYILGDMTGGDCTGRVKVGSSMSQQEKNANADLLNSLKGIVVN